MNDRPLHFALRELRDNFASPRVLAILAVLSLAIAVAGPFNTSALMTFPQRLGYWAVVTPMTYAAGLIGSAIVLALLGSRPFAPASAVFLRAIGSTILVSATLYGFHSAFGHPVPEGGDVLLSVSAVLVICLAIETIGMLIPSQAQELPVSGQLSQPERPALLDRLPLEKRGEVVAVSAVDHYTEVTTTKGRHLILLRLSDAIAEAAPTPGLQIHRSHWVALAHVQRAERQGDAGRVILTSGQDLPIARSRLAQVQAAGLFPKQGQPGQG